jgi:hypothetical protein
MRAHGFAYRIAGIVKVFLPGTRSFHKCANATMAPSLYGFHAIFKALCWEVEFTDEFEQWWRTLSESEQGKVDARLSFLMERGPNLGFPFSSQVKTSRFPEMRELRAQAGGDPLRMLYAFDPRRTAILLVAGDKTGDDRWYETYVPVADRLFERRLRMIDKESAERG